jgi:hypothetical protein
MSFSRKTVVVAAPLTGLALLFALPAWAQTPAQNKADSAAQGAMTATTHTGAKLSSKTGFAKDSATAQLAPKGANNLK